MGWTAVVSSRFCCLDRLYQSAAAAVQESIEDTLQQAPTENSLRHSLAIERAH